ncbi:MAG: TrbI/VirB10 family protein [Candidatus Aminicenantes bacterium]|nr:TrbI/VirB10 family protein [Candidatus Aminicenantes bacterium]
MVTLFEGEYLEGVVLTEIRSDIQAGPVIVKTSRDFYDESGVYVIIPYGTKITGRSQAIDYQGQQRLYIWFERLILPVRTVGERRAAIRLPAAGMALDSRGTAGLVSKVNRHFWLQYGSAILLGVLDGLTGLAQRRAGNGSLSVMVDGSGQNLSQVNASRFSRYSSIMPTVTVNPGTKVKVYMACDIHITAYDLKENRSYAAAIKGGNRE